MLSVERHWCSLLAATAILTVSWAAPLYAETVCTHVIASPEYGVPMDERESIRAAQSRMEPEILAEADELAQAGQLSESAVAYFSILEGRDYRPHLTGWHYRCLPVGVYQRATDRLRPVASRLAARLMEQGDYEDISEPSYAPGALRLLLMSNQYGMFERHAMEYAAKELPQRDVDPNVLAQRRLEELEQIRDAGKSPGYRNLVDDLTPLLDAELAAFDKLPGFESRLQAHLAPLYPKLTDNILAAEAGYYDQAMKTDGTIPKAMLFGQATAALAAGLKRLDRHPRELARLRTRADSRGVALMETDQYAPAQDYFEIAGNHPLAEKAGGLAEAQLTVQAEKYEAAARSAVEKMQKTEEEKAAFQDEADDMAAEFGFELED